MKKRLRKKHHLDEFKEYGFKVWFRFDQELDMAAQDTLLDDFIMEVIEANGLQFGGGGSNEWEGFVTLNTRGSANEKHRTLVETWFKSRPEALTFQVGPLEDAWE